MLKLIAIVFVLLIVAGVIFAGIIVARAGKRDAEAALKAKECEQVPDEPAQHLPYQHRLHPSVRAYMGRRS